MGGAIFFKACGAGKGQGKKKVFSKNTRSSCGALLIRAFLERAGERATDFLWRSRVESNSQSAARREAAEHEKHGIEQSGVISAGEQARTHELLSSRNRDLQLDLKSFGLRR